MIASIDRAPGRPPNTCERRSQVTSQPRADGNRPPWWLRASSMIASRNSGHVGFMRNDTSPAEQPERAGTADRLVPAVHAEPLVQALGPLLGGRPGDAQL